MKGIYLKDLFQIRSSWLILICISVLVSGLLIYYDGAPGLVDFFMIFCAIQASSTIFADKASGWYSLSTTFPITRKELVESKYRFTVCLILAGFLTGLAVWIIVELIQTGTLAIPGEQFLITFYIGCLFVFSMMALLIPLAYYMNKNQEFVAVFLSMIPAFVMLVIWTQRISSAVVMETGSSQIIQEQVDMQTGLLSTMACFSILMFVVSYFVMPKIISKQNQRT